MTARLILALLLALAGLPRLGIGLALTGPSGCEVPVCCRVQVQSSCCEPEPVEPVCHMSGGDCRCGIGSVPDRQDRPEAPAPRTDRQAVAAAVQLAPALVSVLAGGESGVLEVAESSHLRGSRSHNEARALLGVWRT